MERSSEIFIEKWQIIRKKGRFAYALKQGSIMAIIVVIIRSLAKLRSVTFNEMLKTLHVLDFLIVLVGAILGYYVIMWWIYENQYKKYTSKK